MVVHERDGPVQCTQPLAHAGIGMRALRKQDRHDAATLVQGGQRGRERREVVGFGIGEDAQEAALRRHSAKRKRAQRLGARVDQPWADREHEVGRQLLQLAEADPVRAAHEVRRRDGNLVQAVAAEIDARRARVFDADQDPRSVSRKRFCASGRSPCRAQGHLIRPEALAREQVALGDDGRLRVLRLVRGELAREASRFGSGVHRDWETDEQREQQYAEHRRLASEMEPPPRRVAAPESARNHERHAREPVPRRPARASPSIPSPQSRAVPGSGITASVALIATLSMNA